MLFKLAQTPDSLILILLAQNNNKIFFLNDAGVQCRNCFKVCLV